MSNVSQNGRLGAQGWQAVYRGVREVSYELIHADCLSAMKAMADDSVDVTITSPPYTDQRTYGIAFKLSGQGWVDWCAERIVEMCRVTAGIVFFNAAGPVRDFQYQPVVEWLVADLTRKHGIVCGPAPYVFHRVGIPGSGGPHYHRRDWEPIYCFAKPVSLPPRWSDNTATGHPPKWAVGGAMSSRNADGTRKNESAGPKANARWVKVTNQWGGNHAVSGVNKNGERKNKGDRPSHKFGTATKGKTNGDTQTVAEGYDPPTLANSGNKIMETYTAADVDKIIGEANDVRQLKVGGGLMGSVTAHESEAPFPETLVRFFIVSFCKPGGTVLDPFCGSGTSVNVAVQENRNAIGIDIRDGKGGLASARKRMESVTPAGLFDTGD